MPNIVVSTDKGLLNVPLIHAFLTTSYWATGRTIEQVQISIANCICFGVYEDNEQIGFARVLSDKVVFAYLMDVFILDKHRGKGHSKRLMENILQHADLQQVGKWFLGTRDAHGLYQQFGFVEIPKKEMYMELLNRK